MTSGHINSKIKRLVERNSIIRDSKRNEAEKSLFLEWRLVSIPSAWSNPKVIKEDRIAAEPNQVNQIPYESGLYSLVTNGTNE